MHRIICKLDNIAMINHFSLIYVRKLIEYFGKYFLNFLGTVVSKKYIPPIVL